MLTGPTSSAIRSSISLVSLTDDSIGGTFDITASTSNGPVDIVYPSTPVNSTLKFDAHSSNSPVRTTLHTAYEGSYSVATSNWNKPAVHFNDNAEDPSGDGRKRTLETVSLGKGNQNGHVYWGSGDRKSVGSMRLSTSNAGVQLNL